MHSRCIGFNDVQFNVVCDAGVVWEMELDKSPPPNFNVLRPKFWLLRKVRLEKGKHYKLR